MDAYSIKSITRQFFRDYQSNPDRASFNEKILYAILMKEPTEEDRREFERFIPLIDEEIEKLTAQKRKGNILAEMVVSTAKGIIDDLRQTGAADIPGFSAIRGTDKGRVIIYFRTTEKINAPLDHLRARLVRRFKNDK